MLAHVHKCRWLGNTRATQDNREEHAAARSVNSLACPCETPQTVAVFAKSWRPGSNQPRDALGALQAAVHAAGLRQPQGPTRSCNAAI